MACGSGNVRPYVSPFPGARVDSLTEEAASVIANAAQLVVAEGIAVARVSPDEGYLESAWFDLGRGDPGGERAVAPNRVVRFRFWADPIDPVRSVLVSEVAVRWTVDPSLPERQREALAPPEHPGQAVLARILDSLRSGSEP